MLFGLCSVNVFAEDVILRKCHVWIESSTAGVNIAQANVLENETGTATGEVYHSLNTRAQFGVNFTITNEDGSVLLPSGSKYSLLLENMMFRVVVKDDGDGIIESFNYGQATENWIVVYYIYADGTQDLIFTTFQNPELQSSHVTLNNSKNTSNVKLNIEAEKDILKVRIVEGMRITDVNSTLDYAYFESTAGFENYPMKVTIEEEDKSIGLLEGIWNGITDLGSKISNGFTELGNKVTTGFTNMVNGIKDVFNAIKDLPAKIWEFIENGLKSLFVPDEEYMSGYSDKWDSLMASRFGALYEVGDIVVTSWGDIQLADQTDSIQIPEVCLNLPDNCSFTFGGYDVTIVPDGFDVLVNALKLIISLTATYLFINGLIKRYDEIMGVEQ